MWKSAYVGVCQLLNWKMHGETLKHILLLTNHLANRLKYKFVKSDKYQIYWVSLLGIDYL